MVKKVNRQNKVKDNIVVLVIRFGLIFLSGILMLDFQIAMGFNEKMM